MGDAGYDAKLLTLIAGGMPPDIFHVTQQNFPFYAARDVVMPLAQVKGACGLNLKASSSRASSANRLALLMSAPSLQGRVHLSHQALGVLSRVRRVQDGPPPHDVIRALSHGLGRGQCALLVAHLVLGRADAGSDDEEVLAAGLAHQRDLARAADHALGTGGLGIGKGVVHVGRRLVLRQLEENRRNAG